VIDDRLLRFGSQGPAEEDQIRDAAVDRHHRRVCRADLDELGTGLSTDDLAEGFGLFSVWVDC
jgi:hypothetical protein